MRTDRDIAARARLRQAIEQHLDRLESAHRLAGLLGATGEPDPAHQAALFRVRWVTARFIDKLVSQRRASRRRLLGGN
jgi:hypothetical protein